MVEFLVQDSKTIAQLQAAFSEHFPFLKIEFYAKGHEKGQGSDAVAKLDSSLTIGKARTVHTQGTVSIHGNQKVSTLEGAFKDEFGLNVQVFRKSGDLWIQTITTDDWTLSEQNDRAKEIIEDE